MNRRSGSGSPQPLARWWPWRRHGGLPGRKWRTADEPGFVLVPHGGVELSGTIAAIDLLSNGGRITLARPSLDGVETSPIAVTLLTGEDQTTPEAERNPFIAAGLAHILTVAGLPVGIVMGLAFTITGFLLTRHERMALRWPHKAPGCDCRLGRWPGLTRCSPARICRSCAAWPWPVW